MTPRKPVCPRVGAPAPARVPTGLPPSTRPQDDHAGSAARSGSVLPSGADVRADGRPPARAEVARRAGAAGGTTGGRVDLGWLLIFGTATSACVVGELVRACIPEQARFVLVVVLLVLLAVAGAVLTVCGRVIRR